MLADFKEVCYNWGVVDRRQVVRHWVLVPAFAGSNPADPARENTQQTLCIFSDAASCHFIVTFV